MFNRLLGDHLKFSGKMGVPIIFIILQVRGFFELPHPNIPWWDSISRPIRSNLWKRFYFIDHAAAPGVDVTITVSFDFCQFSAKKLAFFSQKPML
jgi:hypothetical protein